MYSRKDLYKLLIPLIIENVMISLMGTVDTIMVSNVGEAAVSGVSLVDAINKLIIFMLQSIATGGTILCSQYLGCKDKKRADEYARQVILCALLVSLLIMGIFLFVKNGLLALIFGTVEASVMEASRTYFLITIFSYPFMAVFNACSSLYRAEGNSRLPMLVSAGTNVLNVIGNAILLFVVKLGIAGAAISTTASVAVSGILMMAFMKRPNMQIEIGKFTKMRPDFKQMLWVLKIGIPTGVENSMFQLGKLVVQSTVSMLGTVVIASNAIVAALELVTSTPSMGISVGLITVAGTCLGAGRLDEAKYYIKKLTLWSGVVLFVTNWAIFFLVKPVAGMAGLTGDALDMTFKAMLMISIVKPFLWPLAFVPANGMRAAGDGTYSMVTASLSMWIIRVGLTTVLCRFMGFGLMGIWLGYELDWLSRSIINVLRFRSGKWHCHKVIKNDIKNS